MVSLPQQRPLDAAEVIRIGRAAGLSAVGVTNASPLEPARSVLPLRKARGLGSSMAFTYKNPTRSTDPSQSLRNAQSLIVGAYDYFLAETPAPDQLSARVARYAWDDYYAQLRAGLDQIAEAIREAGARARVVADQNDLVDRNVAYRAGLGWYGKNANLLLPGQGSWFVLGTVVTDLALDANDTPQVDGCGSCNLCEDGCPTGAILSPGVVDAGRCLAWLLQGPDPIPREFRAAVGDRIYGCDECQDICPPNRTRELADGAAGPNARVPLAWLLEAPDNELLDRVGQWYIAERDPNVVRRSALVALGNTADPVGATTERLLRRHLGSAVPQLRAHAIWAARRLGRDDLLRDADTETDPEVRAEYDGDVAARRFGDTS